MRFQSPAHDRVIVGQQNLDYVAHDTISLSSGNSITSRVPASDSPRICIPPFRERGSRVPVGVMVEEVLKNAVCRKLLDEQDPPQ